MQAWAEGKEIQYRNSFNEWIDIKKNEGLSFIKTPLDYRIKPEDTYRPFETHGECWNEMLKHQPFGWLKSIRKQEKVHILRVFTAMDEVFITLSINGGLANSSDCVFNEYTFDDGTPFGIKEEE